MTKLTFSGSFTQQEAIPEAGIAAALEVLRSGRLHRYNVAAGEVAAASQLERAYADWQGARYCLAVTSGGQAIQIALRAAGVQTGDVVLTNAFTLAPVPGAIEAVKGQAVLVDIDETLRIDIDDLAAKAEATGAKWLLLSHMRGHVCDMDRLMSVADAAGLTVIEDCAHTMGARWNGAKSGSHGLAACFSTQTYKHMNSGEGGLLTSDDPDFMARATIMSGSYMLFERHGASPGGEHFASARVEQPNLSARLDNLRATILLPQLEALEENIRRWNERYRAVEAQLRRAQMVRVPDRPEAEDMVGSSIQFRVPHLSPDLCRRFVSEAGARGVELKWFGAKEPHGFTSTYESWAYLAPQSAARTLGILGTLFDMRLPLTFSVDDCDVIGRIIAEVAAASADW